MPSAFNFSASPFDCLTREEQQLVSNSVDVTYFRPGEIILDVGAVPTHLYVVIKGYVQQIEDGEEVRVYGPDDSFDGRGLVAGKVSNQFVAMEEVVAYQLSKAAVNELISSNSTFGALLFEDLFKKLNALSERRSQHELHTLSMARVDQAFLRPAVFVDTAENVRAVAEIFDRIRTNTVLVQDNTGPTPRLGIFTLRNLSRAILDGTPLDQLAVGRLARWGLVKIKPTDHVYDALATMVRHKVTRVVVMDGDKVVGLLEQVDLLSFLTNSSSLIVQRILQAQSLDQLHQAANEITRLVALLHRNGTRVGMIAKLVQELNATLFDRTWSLIASPELRANSCLFVMGSEGRGEQLLKTDQDNGLIIRDGHPDLIKQAEISCERFSRALSQFGYPECPGKIMVNNPQWCLTLTQFSTRVRDWLVQPTPEGLMDLAIFIDAHSVSGDAELLKAVKEGLFEALLDNDFFLARFAASIDAFSTESGWWNRLLQMGDKGPETLNLKKAGIFAIVHGVRSLALEHRLAETSTLDRLERLVELGKLPRDTATHLIESLHFLMGLRLKEGLRQIETQHTVTGEIDMRGLSALERDLLKDSLNEVKKFKALLRQHFHLEAA